MRQGSGILIALSSLVFAAACSADPLWAAVDGGAPGATRDASITDSALWSFCDGATPLGAEEPGSDIPHVTLRNDAGQGCLFVLGDSLADPQTCGTASLTGYTEACPFTAVDFNVWSDPEFMTEFGVQGHYAWALHAGQLQNGRVLEMAIDSGAGPLTPGHFRVAFDPADGFPGTTVAGTFDLCTSPGTSVEPCRQP